jgi:hypothetical protein
MKRPPERRTGWRLPLIVVVAFMASACSGTTITSPSATPSHAIPSPALPTSSPLAGAVAVPGGCGQTKLYRGGMPSWLQEGIRGLTGMENAPYALAGPTPIAGFILGYPLKAGTNTPSKIMWVVSTPRNGEPLQIRVNPSGAAEPVVTVTRPADSGPGEIYPMASRSPPPGAGTSNLNGFQETRSSTCRIRHRQ